MFYASNEANTVYYSAPRQPEELPIENLFEIGDSISGPIVAMYPTKNALVIFKRFGIYLIKGDPLNGFFAFTLTKDIGCIASKSISNIGLDEVVACSEQTVNLNAQISEK